MPKLVFASHEKEVGVSLFDSTILPYKLSKALLSNQLDHPQNQPSPAPPANSLPITSQLPNTFEYQSSLIQIKIHVKFEFSLYQQILDLLSTAFKLSLQNLFIIVACMQLPPKLWPLTVIGMPLSLTTDSNRIPLKLVLEARGAKPEIDY